jgi:hypothetical protein
MWDDHVVGERITTRARALAVAVAVASLLSGCIQGAAGAADYCTIAHASDRLLDDARNAVPADAIVREELDVTDLDEDRHRLTCSDETSQYRNGLTLWLAEGVDEIQIIDGLRDEYLAAGWQRAPSPDEQGGVRSRTRRDATSKPCVRRRASGSRSAVATTSTVRPCCNSTCTRRASRTRPTSRRTGDSDMNHIPRPIVITALAVIAATAAVLVTASVVASVTDGVELTPRGVDSPCCSGSSRSC